MGDLAAAGSLLTQMMREADGLPAPDACSYNTVIAAMHNPTPTLYPTPTPSPSPISSPISSPIPSPIPNPIPNQVIAAMAHTQPTKAEALLTTMLDTGLAGS